MAAKKPSFFAQMRTIAWLHEAQRQTGATGLTSLANRYAKLTEGKLKATLAQREFKQYAHGKSAPSDDTAKEVEQFLPGTLAVFCLGPQDGGKLLPFWQALGGDPECVQIAIETFDPERIGAMMAESAPFYDIMMEIVGRLGVPEEEILQGMLKGGFPADESNVVAAAYLNGTVTISLRLLVALVAVWRRSIEINTEVPFMGYVMFGLMHKAIYDLLDPWDIAKHVVTYMNDLINRSFLRLVAIHNRTTGKIASADEDDAVEPTA
ncbi:hypothetical protein [Paraburkholderia silvatlantica]|uniref:hypothetical protein n=1 Tax=Paraburkholderia silvatlantica TaxID=321895 RepID=UPI00105E9860|nr:hypothetical protein [Paraburkholderia silvatlantica]TDQ75490.1 hypothetical protein C7412_1427 [Paraburkholderia silvatlantica]